MHLNPTELARFEAKIDRSGDCWLWTGTMRAGYGVFSAKRITRSPLLAHRIAYAHYVAALPGDMLVCHHCDNPPCVRPGHLFLGTPAENMADRDHKGRQARGGRVNTARLAEDDIRAIRGDPRPNTLIAPEYGVTHSAIAKIKRRVTWKHVV